MTNPEFVIPICIGIFIAIVFLQSALDKAFNWKDNLDWLKSHFAKTILSNFVTPMLLILTIFEFCTGITAIVGVLKHLFQLEIDMIQVSVHLALMTLLMLIFGQRLAKDYTGAQTIAVYFGVVLIGAVTLFVMG